LLPLNQLGLQEFKADSNRSKFIALQELKIAVCRDIGGGWWNGLTHREEIIAGRD
jgi:hypothetical protein